MKNIKIYLIIIIVLLVCALGAGVYVWYTIQSLNAVATEQKEVGKVEKGEVGVSETNTTPLSEGSITITKESLSPTQQKTLETLGYTQDSFTITPEMITCAKNAVGEARFDEITKGAAPSPLEAVKLLPCFKK